MSIWLGNLLWWNISGAADKDETSKVTLEELQQLVKDLRMTMPSMPQPRSAHNFRAASGNLQRRYTDSHGLEAELNTHEVSATSDFIVRHVVKTTTDPRTQAVSHEKLAELKFFRPTRTAKGRRPGSEVSRPALKPGLSGVDAEQVVALVEDFRINFATRETYLSGTALRRVVRDFVVLACEGILLRSAGGVYFVNERYANDLMALGKLVHAFGPGCGLHLIPLFDDESQRAMVAEALVEVIVRECRQIVEVASSPRPTHVQLWLARNSMLRLRRLQNHYAALLGQTWFHVFDGNVNGSTRAAEALHEAETTLRAATPTETQGRGGPNVVKRAAMDARAHNGGYLPILSGGQPTHS